MVIRVTSLSKGCMMCNVYVYVCDGDDDDVTQAEG